MHFIFFGKHQHTNGTVQKAWAAEKTQANTHSGNDKYNWWCDKKCDFPVFIAIHSFILATHKFYFLTKKTQAAAVEGERIK